MSSEPWCVDCGRSVATVGGAVCGACYLRRVIDGRPMPVPAPPPGWVRCARCGVFFPSHATVISPAGVTCVRCRPAPAFPPPSAVFHPHPAPAAEAAAHPPPEVYRVALWCGVGGLVVGAAAGVVAGLNGWQGSIPGVVPLAAWVAGELGSAVVAYTLLAAALLAFGAVAMALSDSAEQYGGCGCIILLLVAMWGFKEGPKFVAGSSHLFASAFLCAAGFGVQCVLVGPFVYVLWRGVFPPPDPDALPDDGPEDAPDDLPDPLDGHDTAV